MDNEEQNKQKKLFQDFLSGKISRRNFLIAAAALAGGYGLSKLLPDLLQIIPDSNPLTADQEKVLKAVQRYLFPSTESSPGADDINAFSYMQFVFIDPELDPRDQKFIINGIGWLEEECQKIFSSSFTELEFAQKEQILRQIEKENWGERWLSNLLKYIFEALLADPIYGGNPNEIGWEWLSHVPGIPRPTQQNRYRGMP